MAKVVEVTVFDTQELARAREAGADRIGVERESAIINPWHRIEDRRKYAGGDGSKL